MSLKHRSCPPTARDERMKREIQLAVAESEQRLSDKLDQLGASLEKQTRVSRRRFVASSALGVAGVATSIIIGLTTDQPQAPQTFTIGKSRLGGPDTLG